MKKTFTLLSDFFLKIGIFCGGSALIPSPAEAAWPAQNYAAVQPVLITALAFTSLVLFLIYVFTRKQSITKASRSQARATPKDEPLASKTDLALEQLFNHNRFSIAKLSLDGVRILDATPSLYKSLGYTKAGLMETSGGELGMIREQEIPQIMTKGWSEAEARLFNRESGDWKICGILNILCRSGNPPCILSIVSGISEQPASEPLPGFISDLLDNRRIIQ